MTRFDRFPRWDPETGEGPGAYLPGPDVADAVNAALAAGQPLLVTGEPGVGKTELAAAIHWHLDDPGGQRWGFDRYVVRSDSHGRDLLYHFDHLMRLHEVQLRSEHAADASRYVRLRALGRAYQSATPTVVLIDEIDKAPRDFPNDLLHELDKRTLKIEEAPELPEIVAPAELETVVLVTSNDERDLPEAFLRRCVFLQIPFPTPQQLERIVRQRFGLPVHAGEVTSTRPPRPPDPAAMQQRSEFAASQQDSARLEALSLAATRTFIEVRGARPSREWRKIPSIGELLRWVRVLRRSEIDPALITAGRLDHLYPGVLIKTREDGVALKLRSGGAH